MDNIRISELPAYSGSASGSYLIINDSSQSNTYKITRETLLSGYTASFSVSASAAVLASSSNLLDGLHSSAFAKLDAYNIFTRDIVIISASAFEIGTYEADTFYILDELSGSEIGFSNKLSHFDGPNETAGIYVSSGSNLDYLTAIEIPNGPDFIQPSGSVRIKFPLEVTGSVTVKNLIQLAQQHPLPASSVGNLASSGSNLYFHDGGSWRQVQLV